MLKRRALLLAKYTVSIGLVALILLRADLSSFVDSMKQVNILLFAVSLLVVAFNMLVRSYKWQLLMKAHSVRMPLLTAQNINYMSLFFNNFFLGSIGGDTFRAYRAMTYCDSKGGAVSSVIMERMTGVVAAVSLVLVVGAAFIVTNQHLVRAEQLLGLLLLGIIAGLVMLAVFKFHSRLAELASLGKFGRIKNPVAELADSMKEYKSHRQILAAALGLSFLYHIINAVSVYLFILASNAEVSLLPLFFITPLVAMLVMVPVSINGIGIQEGSYVFYLEQIGLAGPSAFLVAVLSRISLLILSLVGGLLFISANSRRQPVTLAARRESLSS